IYIYIYIYIYIFICFIAKDGKDDGDKIIGGLEVLPNTLKYQGALLALVASQERKPYCGCTLIAAEWAVSAAHCWRPTSAMMLVFGEHNLWTIEGFEQFFNVSKIYLHNFNFRTYNNDIMLIKLSQPAIINAYVEPAPLPTTSTPPLHADMCTVSGWGVTSLYNPQLSDNLRAVDVQLYPSCDYFYWGRVNSNMLCAGHRFGGRDACQ
ncbi:hypothetical protein NL108_012653, partial [Boleophthalmus pectinirostris]